MDANLLMLSVLLSSLRLVESVSVPILRQPSVLPTYDYHFGKRGVGKHILTKEDWIGVLKYNTDVFISAPPDTEVTYVRVTVSAINPPKVEYDKESRIVSINYSLLEFTGSSYKIYAEGKRKQDQERKPKVEPKEDNQDHASPAPPPNDGTESGSGVTYIFYDNY